MGRKRKLTDDQVRLIRIARMQKDGRGRTGDDWNSLKGLAEAYGVSIATVKRAMTQYVPVVQTDEEEKHGA